MNLDERIENLSFNKEVLKSPNSMQQHNFDVLMHEEE
jgi:hypothetical protein